MNAGTHVAQVCDTFGNDSIRRQGERMIDIDILRVQDGAVDTITISVGENWIEIPTSMVNDLISGLNEEAALG